MPTFEIIQGTKISNQVSLFYLTEEELEIDLICIRINDKLYSFYYNGNENYTEAFYNSIITILIILDEMNMKDRMLPMIQTFMTRERDRKVIEMLDQIPDLAMLNLTE